jgi:hypothetical protein
MIGTADPVDVWVLLEYPPAWKARAVEESGLDPAARAWLDRGLAALAQRGLKPRPQLIRQPERGGDVLRLLVGVPGFLVEFSGRGYDFLERVDLEQVVREPARFPAVASPQYFVCTNGQRDVCCARFGLPLYTGLRQRVYHRAWQISHLGGHRFAPNVLALPQGTVYGRVSVADLDAFVAAVEADRLVFDYLRGRAWYPPAVQAAEALSGESGLTFLHLDGDDAAAIVTFASAHGERVVRVRRATEPMAVLKSCTDEAAKPVTPYLAG